MINTSVHGTWVAKQATQCRGLPDVQVTNERPKPARAAAEQSQKDFQKIPRIDRFRWGFQTL